MIFRYKRGASQFEVCVPAREVYDFAIRWPCSSLRRNWPVTFVFDIHNGDLVDTNAAQNHPNADGSAIVALCEDAKQYGLSKLKETGA